MLPIKILKVFKTTFFYKTLVTIIIYFGLFLGRAETLILVLELMEPLRQDRERASSCCTGWPQPLAPPPPPTPPQPLWPPSSVHPLAGPWLSVVSSHQSQNAVHLFELPLSFKWPSRIIDSNLNNKIWFWTLLSVMISVMFKLL